MNETVNGKREGEWKCYHENGNLYWIRNYKDGKLIEHWKLV